MTRALLALGGNMGDRLEYLRNAAAGLGTSVVKASNIYETPPWPPGEQAPMYLNAVVLVENARVDAHGWLKKAADLEYAAGRTREMGRQYAPRTLDVDILMVWDDSGRPVSLASPELTLPHPRAYVRAFVLLPWLDVQPDGEIPGFGKIKDLLQSSSVAADLGNIRQITEGF